MKSPRNIIIAILVFAGLISGVLWWTWGRTPFDPAAWKRADLIDNFRTVRSAMVDDLLRRYDFRGWTRQQVEELLGPPEQGEPKDSGFPQFDSIYLLGLERQGSFSLDDEALGFKFDDEKVVKFGLAVN